MKTIFLLLMFTCSGMIWAQTPVIDWEEAPDKMKIRSNDKNEYARIAPETKTNEIQFHRSIASKEKLVVKGSAKKVPPKKKRVAKVAAK